MNLSDFQTWELVEELKTRQGVVYRAFSPYEPIDADDMIDQVKTGPALVFLITD